MSNKVLKSSHRNLPSFPNLKYWHCNTTNMVGIYRYRCSAYLISKMVWEGAQKACQIDASHLLSAKLPQCRLARVTVWSSESFSPHYQTYWTLPSTSIWRIVDWWQPDCSSRGFSQPENHSRRRNVSDSRTSELLYRCCATAGSAKRPNQSKAESDVLPSTLWCSGNDPVSECFGFPKFVHREPLKTFHDP